MKNHLNYWDESNKESFCSLPPFDIYGYLDNNSKIVEFGVGSGRVLRCIKQNGYKGTFYGTDLSRIKTNRLKSEFTEDYFFNCDCKNTGLNDNTFDVCILSALLTCNVDDKDIISIFKESERVLKNEGVIFISDFLITYNLNNTYRYIKHFLKGKRFGVFESEILFRHFNKKFILRHLAKQGFVIEQIKNAKTKTWNKKNINGFTIIARKPCV